MSITMLSEMNLLRHFVLKQHWRILVDVKKQKMTNESKIALNWMDKIKLLIGDEMSSVVSTKTILEIEKRFADWENKLDYV